MRRTDSTLSRTDTTLRRTDNTIRRSDNTLSRTHTHKLVLGHGCVYGAAMRPLRWDVPWPRERDGLPAGAATAVRKDPRYKPQLS